MAAVGEHNHKSTLSSMLHAMAPAAFVCTSDVRSGALFSMVCNSSESKVSFSLLSKGWSICHSELAHESRVHSNLPRRS